jgi:hypothetical protein
MTASLAVAILMAIEPQDGKDRTRSVSRKTAPRGTVYARVDQVGLLWLLTGFSPLAPD